MHSRSTEGEQSDSIAGLCAECSGAVGKKYFKGLDGTLRCEACAVAAYKKTNGYLVDKYRVFGRGGYYRTDCA